MTTQAQAYWDKRFAADAKAGAAKPSLTKNKAKLKKMTSARAGLKIA